MNNWDALFLGLIQGLTEYLPVSSSGHLEISRSLFGIDSGENLMFTVLLHGATVLSTICVLWKEIWDLLRHLFQFKWNEQTQYILKICVSMIPVLIVGLFLKDYVEELFGNGLLLIGCMLIVTALLLAFSHFAKPRPKQSVSWKDSFIIGIAQALAVLPGLSRSGSTIATGIMLGNSKEKVAQFSFLMVIVPILGEMFLDIVGGDFTSAGIPGSCLVIGFISAFLSGCVACRWMINLVRQSKLIWFAVYCAIVGLLTVILPLL